MALPEKMKEILAGFWSRMNRYEEAYESGDRDAALRCGEEVLEYCLKYQKELNFSDEYLADMKKSLVTYKESIAKAAFANADLEEATRQRIISERNYLKALAEIEKSKEIKWN